MTNTNGVPTDIKEQLRLMCELFVMDPRSKACILEAKDYIEKLEQENASFEKDRSGK